MLRPEPVVGVAEVLVVKNNTTVSRKYTLPATLVLVGIEDVIRLLPSMFSKEPLDSPLLLVPVEVTNLKLCASKYRSLVTKDLSKSRTIPP
jgi:hypothetical protein